MTNQEIFDLVACFDRSTAQTMKLSTQEFTILLSPGGAAAPLRAPPRFQFSPAFFKRRQG